MAKTLGLTSHVMASDGFSTKTGTVETQRGRDAGKTRQDKVKESWSIQKLSD